MHENFLEYIHTHTQTHRSTTGFTWRGLRRTMVCLANNINLKDKTRLGTHLVPVMGVDYEGPKEEAILVSHIS